jgi:hypothetical protein
MHVDQHIDRHMDRKAKKNRQIELMIMILRLFNVCCCKGLHATINTAYNSWSKW